MAGFEQYEATCCNSYHIVLTCSCCNLLTAAVHADNQLSGTIATFTAPYLKDLIIAGNELTGTVPSTILSLPQVYRIDLVISRTRTRVALPATQDFRSI